jgi:hypothetical protein
MAGGPLGRTVNGAGRGTTAPATMEKDTAALRPATRRTP